MSDGDIIVAQLAEGNLGAQAYFMKRVEFFLRDSRQPADKLYRFMRAFWPAFEDGVQLLQARSSQAGRPTPNDEIPAPSNLI